MKYAMLGIETKEDMSHAVPTWWKTERGWEVWCDKKKLYNTANEAYTHMAKCDGWTDTTIYEIVEVEV